MVNIAELVEGNNHPIGPYKVVRHIGGKNDTVYQAFHQDRPEEPLALKLAKPGEDVPEQYYEGDNRATMRDLMGNEPYILLGSESRPKIEHPNILGIVDSGATGIGTELLLWNAYRYIDAIDTDILTSGGIRIPNILKIILGVAKACAYLHSPEVEVIHRDIKPDNILVERDSYKPRLTDFGIAGYFHELQEVYGGVIGSPYHMSPEQARGLPVGPKSDTFSLGLTAYEMLTGELAVKGKASIDAILNIANGVIWAHDHPVSEFRSDARPELDKLVREMMQYDSRDRPSMEEVVSRVDMIKHLPPKRKSYFSIGWEMIRGIFAPGKKRPNEQKTTQVRQSSY